VSLTARAGAVALQQRGRRERGASSVSHFLQKTKRSSFPQIQKQRLHFVTWKGASAQGIDACCVYSFAQR
jgi:hypothetical protein